MNNRQAGAFRELVRKEERAREQWAATYGNRQMNPDNQQQPMMPPGQPYPSYSSPPQDAFQAPMGYMGPPMGAPMGPPMGPPMAPMGASRAPEGNYGMNYGEQSPLMPADNSIYNQATRVSSPRMADDPSSIPTHVARKVVRQVEVPFTRDVMVPVKTQKIVPTRVQKKVKTTRLVEVPTYKTVEETYMTTEERPAVRQKEIWVKKVVPERYMKQVPVTRTRQVKVPTTAIREVDDYEIVEVGGNKVVDVDGFRVDKVQDTKLMEVEENQTYALQPVPQGPAQLSNTRDIGPIRGAPGMPLNRSGPMYEAPGVTSPLRNSGFAISGGRPGSGTRGFPAAPMAPMGTMGPMGPMGPMGSSGPLGPMGPMGPMAPMNSMPPTRNADMGGDNQPRVGFRVKDCDSNGVAVYKVNPGEAGEAAGLNVGDVVMYVNNKPTRNLQEFRGVVSNSAGPLLLQIRRRGNRKLTLTVVR